MMTILGMFFLGCFIAGILLIAAVINDGKH